MTVTAGEMVDIECIREDILDLAQRFVVDKVAYDPLQATMLVTELMKDGLACTEVRPTVLNFSQPMKQLDGLIRAGRIEHDGCPVMTWMVGNIVAVDRRQGQCLPAKAAGREQDRRRRGAADGAGAQYERRTVRSAQRLHDTRHCMGVVRSERLLGSARSWRPPHCAAGPTWSAASRSSARRRPSRPNPISPWEAWEELPALPEAVHHPAAAAMVDRVYIAGGYTDLRFSVISQHALIAGSASAGLAIQTCSDRGLAQGASGAER